MYIPPLFVALSALLAAVFLLCSRYIDVRIIALPLFMQFLVYMSFTFFDFPIETRQFIARANAITVNLAFVIIILASRWHNRHG